MSAKMVVFGGVWRTLADYGLNTQFLAVLNSSVFSQHDVVRGGRFAAVRVTHSLGWFPKKQRAQDAHEYDRPASFFHCAFSDL